MENKKKTVAKLSLQSKVKNSCIINGVDRRNFYQHYLTNNQKTVNLLIYCFCVSLFLNFNYLFHL